MKRLLYIFLILVGSLQFFSCANEDYFLEKRLGSDVTVDSIFTTKQKSMAAIAQAYAMSLQSGITIKQWDSNRTNGLRGGTLSHLSGEVNALKFSWQDAWKIQRSGMTANEGDGKPLSTDSFLFNYQTIRQCYLVIDNIDKVVDLTPTEKKAVKAEMLTLIAYRYEEMFKRYGGVPIVDKLLDVNSQAIPRATLKQTLDHIITLCDAALTDLPDTYNSTNKGRVTKGIPLCIKAEALMFAARPLFNTATPYMSLGANNNLICLGTEDPSLWQKAVEANLEVLNWAIANGYAIINTGNPFKDYGTAVATPNNQGVSFSTWTRGTRIVSRNYSRIISGTAQTTDRDSNYEVKDDYGTNQWNRLQFKLGLGYSHDFGDSRLNAAVDYLQYLYHIDANLNGKAGLSNDYAFQNIGGRIYYNLRNRYAAELGFAISGSDNYKKGNRFGFYHALSFAWNIFNEQHPATNKNINLLRLRASVGTTGNDQYNGERYLYQKYYSSIGGGGFATGNDDPTWHTAIGLRSIPNGDIFAEKSYKYNLGIDAEFFKHLNVTLDAFLNKHEGIVTPDNSLSSVFGATPPYRNIGKVTNKGFEIAANYTSSIGWLTYTLGANASYAINKIDAMAEYDALTEASAQIANTIAN